MSSPTDEQRRRVKEKIAEVLRWTKLSIPDNMLCLYGYRPREPDGPYRAVPDWPGSLDVARGLEITDQPRFEMCLYDIIIPRELKPQPPYNHAPKMIWYTAYQWCLAWLLYMGWRWEECADCIDGKVNTIEPEQQPIDCPKCSGQNGDWINAN